MVSPISNSSVMNARHALQRNQAGLVRTTTRLATGRKINSGKDDPAGLISSEQLAAEIKALEAQTQSLQRANTSASITEGHASQLSGMMSELNVLVVASANEAGLSDAEIAANQMQVDSLVSNIERVRNDVVTSLDGFNMPDNGNTEVENLIDGATAALSSIRSGGANSLSSGNLEAAMAAIKGAIGEVATARGQIGAYQKYHVEPNVRANQVAVENLEESRSRIADADYAVETSNLTRFNILTTASIKVLKIAQQQGAAVLSLLK